MYLAKAVAQRSIDVSRQVGATIFTKSGEIISQGCNEVPKAGGGTYWADEEEDARDVVLGIDPNDERKRLLARDFITRLDKAQREFSAPKGEILAEMESEYGPFITPSYQPPSAEILNALLESQEIAESQLMDILEFGRVVHAEMSALCDAARLGRSTVGSILFCTTFPCHMCAKHIVAAGVDRVIFLEPYPKSGVADLHPDSVELSGHPAEESFSTFRKVRFDHFFGITPRRYSEVFEKGKRKRGAQVLKWVKEKPMPLVSAPYPIYLDHEDGVALTFAPMLQLPEIKDEVDFASEWGPALRPRSRES